MTNGTVRLGAVLALALAAQSAHGGLIVSAPFDNTSVWTVATTTTQPGETVLGSLSKVYLGYTFNGMTISSGGASASTLMAQNSGTTAAHQYNVAFASLGTAISGGSPPPEVWASFLFEDAHTGTSRLANGQLGILWMDSNNDQSHTEKTGFGFNVASNAGQGEAQLPNGSGRNVATGGSVNSNVAQFIVAELSGLSAGNYTILNVWIDPTDSAALAGSPTVTVDGSVAASKLTEIGFRATVSPNDTLYFGDPEVATTEQGVLPTPEPSVFALTGIGLLGLGLLLRRKAK